MVPGPPSAVSVRSLNLPKSTAGARQEPFDDRRPNPHALRRMQEEVTLGSKRRQQMEFGVAAGRAVRIAQTCRQVGSKIGVVAGVEPKRRRGDRAAELLHQPDEALRRTVVIWATLRMTAMAAGEIDH